MTLATTTPVGRAFADAGVKADALNAVVNELRRGRTADSAGAEDSFEALNKYARDLTAVARPGKLDPVIGRHEEIHRPVQILERRPKHTPGLTADPGRAHTSNPEGKPEKRRGGQESVRTGRA